MSTISAIHIDAVPRTFEGTRELRRSVRFRLMLQSGAFTDENQKKAYGSIPSEDEQANILLEALKAYDLANGKATAAGVPAPAPQTAPAAPVAPVAAAPAVPMGAPQPPAPATMQQMPMPGMMTTPAAPAAPQPPVQAVAPAPAAPAAPVGPMASMPMPTGPLPGMPSMPGTPAPAPAPQAVMPSPMAAPVAPAQQPVRDPDNGPTTSSVGGEDLATVLANQGKLAESMQHLASSIDSLVTGINTLQGQVLSSSGKVDVALVMLLTFIDAKMEGATKEELITYWKQCVEAGVLTGLLQEMSNSGK